MKWVKFTAEGNVAYRINLAQVACLYSVGAGNHFIRFAFASGQSMSEIKVTDEHEWRDLLAAVDAMSG